MSRDTLTDAQRASIHTLDRPLVISAGAGSGKTFTLTRRIVYALLDDSGPYIDDIDQVLAITFTEKAALEIKARVRSALRAEGMIDQALKVDAAWISTIHGMCSRILRENALTLGIDPGFKIIEADVAERELDEAVAGALADVDELVTPVGMDALFAEYPARTSGMGSPSNTVEGMLRAIVDAGLSSPDGFDGLVLPPSAPSPEALVVQACDLWDEALPAVTEVAGSATGEAMLAAGTQACEKARAALGRGREMSYADAVKAIDAFPRLNGRLGSKTSLYRQRYQEWNRRFGELLQNAAMGQAAPLLDQLIELARRVADAYTAAKRRLHVLDNNDLLVQTHRAFVEHPEIAAAYEGRFKLVMVDEFQDTDQLQIDMIKRLSGPDACHLCTVGDAQQSIYRFRGADVSVYDRHVADMRSRGEAAAFYTLDLNFRSHGDILSFVDRVFEGPDGFGDAFMSLGHGRDESSVKAPYRGTAPRIDVMVTQTPRAARGEQVASSADALQLEAVRIAARFRALRDEGHRAGDMVILLRRMTNADVYAQALRDVGMDCVIAGGSLFGSMPETVVVSRLAQVLTDPEDSTALFEVLSSDLFNVSADDLLVLATDQDASPIRRRNITKGMEAVRRRMQEGAAVSPGLAHAIGVLERGVARVGSDALADIVTDVIVESGWLTRLEGAGPQGMATAGNILKAVRVLGDIEDTGCGAATSARRMAATIELAKEAPGALSTGAGDFVRIMTIHASKGLEFPIVALADFAGEARADTSRMLKTSVGGRTYLSLDADAFYGQFDDVKKRIPKADEFPKEERPHGAKDVQGAATPSERRRAIQAYECGEDEAEAKRLLYVALTRASEALVVALRIKESKGGSDAYKGSALLVNEALVAGAADCGAVLDADGLPAMSGDIPYGGSEPARFERVVVGLRDEEHPDEGIQKSMPKSDGQGRAFVAGGLCSPREPGLRCVQTRAWFETAGDAGTEDAASAGAAAEGAGHTGGGRVTAPAVGAVAENVVGATSAVAPAEAAMGGEAPAAPDTFDIPQQPQPRADDYAWLPTVSRVESYSSLANGADADAADVEVQVDQNVAEAFDDSLIRMGGNGAALSTDDDDALWDQLARTLASDVDKATDVGSAFHQLAQTMVIERNVRGGAGPLVMPTDDQIATAIRRNHLDPSVAGRLRAALGRWVSSDEARTMAGYQDLRAEVPFFFAIDVGEDEPLYMEGSIDLLACEPDSATAHIVDYKTGGRADETPDALAAKHVLQAETYTYALLRQGMQHVDATFVRVEQESAQAAGQPQCVVYRFDAADRDKLHDAIVAAYRNRRA